MMKNIHLATSFLTLFLAAAATVSAQTAKSGAVTPLSSVKFEQDSDLKCLSSVLENGDPDKGPSTFILKAPPNCLVPWHYHTAEEQLIVVQGNVLAEMEGIAPSSLGPGGFAVMRTKVKHQFSCESKSACIMFVTFDRTYDIFWVKQSETPKNPHK